MRVILNSDVLHTKRPLVTGLPAHIDRFCREAAGVGAVLVLPKTALLEDTRHQRQLAEEEIATIDTAMTALKRWGIELPVVDARQLVKTVDLAKVLRATGVQVEVEDPLLEDYREAERRACLHLPPQAPKADTDEMRDLVIWAVALRVARRDGRAILVSRDEVHSDTRGDAEAAGNGLFRAKSLDEALDLLGRESPAGALASSMLDTIWKDLRSAGLPVPIEAAGVRIAEVAFLTDEEGRTGGRFRFSLDVPEGRLSARANVFQLDSDQVRAELRDVTLGSSRWQSGELTVVAKGRLPGREPGVDDRLDALRALLGDMQ
jgi:hypothetical protein